MFTRVHDDGCYVHDRDGRNEDYYRWLIDQDPNFRRENVNDVHKQIYRQNRRGVEQDIEVENRLFDLNHVLGSCNSYQAGIQQERVDVAPQYNLKCLESGLQPSYTKLSRTANHSYTYENPNRAQPGWYYFVTPPAGVQYPGRGLYAFDRKSVDTRQAEKDRILARTQQEQIRGQSRQNPHFVPLLKGECNHFGLFQKK